MDNRIVVSAVSYLNSAPLVYGLQHSPISNKIILELDYPAECANKLLSGRAQIGLVPVYALISKPSFRIVSDFCISATHRVRTVSLISNSSLDSISRIYLDSHSRTSVALLKVLANYHWKKEFEWIDNFEIDKIDSLKSNEAFLAIGDKVFELEHKFKYNIDLALEWKIFSGLPMVFAVWASNIELEYEFISMFNNALSFGIMHIQKFAIGYINTNITYDQVVKYLTENISYDFNAEKLVSINKFYELALKLNNN